ncbi:TMEM175 family protein [Arthrobacter sp. NPDC058130]|uniref:TMEM175 family protein n=1 Tax=Arthrobacter sp. NPDC058130 TaxID=3346353 RepID=UPI0036E5AD08
MNAGTSVERMVYFSDAVFAIALTLLALDLKLPEGIPAAQLDSALVAALPQLLAYALSFVIIAKTWMSHHADFALIRRFNANLARLNLALLFFIAMLPGPTSILSDYGDDPTPWPSILYAANISAVYLMLAAIWGYAKHAGLMDREMAAHVHGRIFNARVAVALVFLLSIPAAFTLNSYTPFFWLLLLPASWLAGRLSASAAKKPAAKAGNKAERRPGTAQN